MSCVIWERNTADCEEPVYGLPTLEATERDIVVIIRLPTAK